MFNVGEIGVCIYADGGDAEETEHNYRGKVLEKAVEDGIQSISGETPQSERRNTSSHCSEELEK